LAALQGFDPLQQPFQRSIYGFKQDLNFSHLKFSGALLGKKFSAALLGNYGINLAPALSAFEHVAFT
jgi:hypothetical protein